MNGPSPPPPPPPGPGPASTFTGDSRADVAQLPTEQLEKLLSDEEAFKAFARAWLQSTGGARMLREVGQQNVTLALENVEMQSAIDEARTHVAIVKSSDYAAAKEVFDQLFKRQEAVLSRLSPVVLLQRLRHEVDKMDSESDELLESYYGGGMGVEAFVEQYLARRGAFHSADIKRQVAEHSFH